VADRRLWRSVVGLRASDFVSGGVG
jgi:hypothetical protein